MICLNIICFTKVKFELQIFEWITNGSGFTTTDKINWPDLEAATEAIQQK